MVAPRAIDQSPVQLNTHITLLVVFIDLSQITPQLTGIFDIKKPDQCFIAHAARGLGMGFEGEALGERSFQINRLAP